MGKFDGFKVSGDLPEEFSAPAEKKEKQDNGKPWSFKPGKYDDCVISAVEELADPCRADPTWIKLRVTFKLDRREIRHLVLVPTQDLTYGPERKATCFNMLQRFLKAFGVELTTSNAQELIPGIFSDPNCLIGQKATITVGHQGYYSYYLDRNTYHCYDKFDKPVCEKGTANPVCFPSSDAVANFVEDHMHKEFSAFPNVRTIEPAKVPSTKPLYLPKKKEDTPKKKVAWN